MFLGKVEPMKTYSSHVYREVGDRFCSIVKCDDDGVIVSRAIHATLGKALFYGRAMCKAANDKAHAVEKVRREHYMSPLFDPRELPPRNPAGR